jgi:hypothetical protein
MRDGAPVRDRVGKQFRLDSEAIEHSKLLATRVRNEGRDEPDLAIVVLNESGREIHRKPVHLPTSTQP